MIPQFKNTEEALQYGKAIEGINKYVLELKAERRRLKRLYNNYMTKDMNKEALHLASGQIQFIREAIEEAIKD